MADKDDFIFPGWDFTPLYDYIDKCKALYKNVSEVYQYTDVDALFNGIVRPQDDGSVDLCLRSTNCQYLNDANEVQYGKDVVDTVVFGHLKEGREAQQRSITYRCGACTEEKAKESHLGSTCRISRIVNINYFAVFTIPST